MAVKFGVKARELKENPVKYLTIFGRIKSGSLKLKTATTSGDAPSLFRGYSHAPSSAGSRRFFRVFSYKKIIIDCSSSRHPPVERLR